MTEESPVRYELDGTTAVITIDRPERMNALTLEMRRAISRRVREADGDETVRSIVVTGAGDAFCAGMDLDALGEGDAREMIDPDAEDDLTLRTSSVTTPIVAAINGACIAAGLEFVLATDIRIAAETATFGLREPRWGLVPAAGSHVRLPRQLSYCRAMEYLLTGELFDADHALRAGLINEVVPEDEVRERADEIAAAIAKNSPDAVRRSKEIVDRTRSLPVEEGYRIEAEIGAEVLESEDAVEGRRAYEEGRDPAFRR